MKIAVVCPYDLSIPGGVQDQTRRITNWLQEAGHDARIVAPGAAEEGVSVGRTFVVPVNGSRAPVTIRPEVVRRVRAAVSFADVVHVHEPLVPLVGPAAIRSTGRGVVATFHADPPRWVRRGYRVGAALVRRILGPVRVATAVSPVARDAVAPFIDARLVPNGIDVADYRLFEERVPGRIVFVGRDDPRKGLDLLLRAWPAVVRAVPEASLSLVGATRADLPPGVVGLGRVPEAEKRRALATAEILCAPNTHGESFGIVLAEGMAAGCAVVASDLPGFRFVLTSEGSTEPAGRLVRPSDVGDLSRALVDLLRDEGERGALAEAGGRRVVAFDRAAVVAGYVAAYRDALAAPPVPGA